MLLFHESSQTPFLSFHRITSLFVVSTECVLLPSEPRGIVKCIRYQYAHIVCQDREHMNR